MQALQLAKESCPAFKSACPFRNVQDAESMKRALQSLPKSHIDSARSSFSTGVSTGIGVNDTDTDTGTEDGRDASDSTSRRASEIGESLRVAMTHVHTISQSLGGNMSAASSIGGEEETSTSEHDGKRSRSGSLSPFQGDVYTIPGLATAMEDFSLFGLMGKMIEENGNGGSGSTTQANTTTNTTTKTNTTNTQEPKTGMKRIKSATSLSHALKHGTQESHNAAESVHFVKEFIKGNIDRTLYSILILNLLHLYQNLERLLNECAPLQFPSLHFPKELSRTEALEEDVDFFHGANANGEASPATLDYIKRIEYIAEKEPLLLLSHAYTRYMGDLSGGKIMARVAKRALDLQGGEDHDGLAFYHFEEISSAKLFKDGYRTALDKLSLEEEQIERLVAEANVAFVLNMRIFEELDVLSGIEGAEVRDYEEATVYYDACVKKQKERMDRGSGGGDFFVQEEEDETKGEGDGDGEEGITKKCPFAILGGPNPHKTPQKDSTSTSTTTEVVQNDSNSSGDRMRSSQTLQNSNTTQSQSVNNDNDSASKAIDGPKERCPWPFVFFHDPATGMQDYQTWIVIGLLLCSCWSFIQK
jgi:heme oxygenase